MSAHTPGPWEIVRGDDGNYAIADGGIGMVVAWSQASNIATHGCIANLADARLIASAPELLEALIAARQWLDADARRLANSAAHSSRKAIVRGIDRAISKTTGEAR